MKHTFQDHSLYNIFQHILSYIDHLFQFCDYYVIYCLRWGQKSDVSKLVCVLCVKRSASPWSTIITRRLHLACGQSNEFCWRDWVNAKWCQQCHLVMTPRWPCWALMATWDVVRKCFCLCTAVHLGKLPTWNDHLPDVKLCTCGGKQRGRSFESAYLTQHDTLVPDTETG